MNRMYDRTYPPKEEASFTLERELGGGGVATMSTAEDPVTSPSISGAESHLQPFFVLHKASPSKPAPKIRRRIDLSPGTSSAVKEECNDKLRLETFEFLWSNTESIINDVLKNLNTKVFDKIDKWVRASFDSIRASRTLDLSSAPHMYPILDSTSIVTKGASTQIFTTLLFTKNVEFVDDISTFASLGEHLRTHGCYVANLTSLDFTGKNGVGGCLKALLRQFLTVGIDAPDMSILASWYTEQGKFEKPLVVIIDDVERCCGPVLNDFIVILREWVVKIPILLVLGVATTVDALRNILSSNTCLYLCACEFYLGTPAERMDAVIEAILKSCQSFSIGKHVYTFLRNYFSRHDGTLALFVKALKIAMAQQVYAEPLSFILCKLVNEEGAEGFVGDSRLQREHVIKQTLELPSLQRYSQPGANYVDWGNALSALKTHRKLWSTMVMCLHEVGRYRKITLLDLCCEMLEPEPHNSVASDHKQLTKNGLVSIHNPHSIGSVQSEGYVVWASQLLRDLPAAELCKLLNRWEMLARGATEIHKKVKELQSLTTLEENRPKRDLREENKPTARSYINDKSNKTTINEKVATFLRDMVREYIQPIENIPFHEIVFFNNVNKLQAVEYS